MNTKVIIIEIITMIILFSFMTLGMLLINPLTFISDYPIKIQEEYYRSQNKEATKTKMTTIMKIKKIIAIIVFIFVLACMLHKAGCITFIQGFIYANILIFILFAWDTFILDWIFFPNIKRVRLKGTEHMEKEYHPKWFHVKVSIPAIPLFILMAVISSFVMTLIW